MKPVVAIEKDLESTVKDINVECVSGGEREDSGVKNTVCSSRGP